VIFYARRAVTKVFRLIKRKVSEGGEHPARDDKETTNVEHSHGQVDLGSQNPDYTHLARIEKLARL
jgi:hypothetical protein